MILTRVLAAVLASTSPSMSTWVEPAGPAIMAIVGSNTNASGFYVPVGVGLKLHDFELITTISVAFWAPLNDANERQVLEFEGSVGPVFHPIVGDSPSWLDGFFVEPKVVIDVGFRSGVGQNNFGCAQLGLDLGYQLRVGYFFAALVTGAGLGFGVMPSSIAGVLGLSTLPATPRVVWSANVSFLRLGVAF